MARRSGLLLAALPERQLLPMFGKEGPLARVVRRRLQYRVLYTSNLKQCSPSAV